MGDDFIGFATEGVEFAAEGSDASEIAHHMTNHAMGNTHMAMMVGGKHLHKIAADSHNEAARLHHAAAASGAAGGEGIGKRLLHRSMASTHESLASHHASQ